MPGELTEVRDEERLRLLLVIDAEAGSEYADREAARLGLTMQLAVARSDRLAGVCGALLERPPVVRGG